MSAVIKSNDAKALAARVRALDEAAPPAVRKSADVVPPETMALKREIETHTRQAQQQADEISHLKAAVEKSRRDGEADGRRAGRAEAEAQDAARLGALQDGLERALARFEAEVDELERLSPLLALEALRKVIGDPASYAEILERSISHAIAGLRAGAAVRLEVSSQDFPDLSVLRDVASGGVEIRALDELAAGQCRIGLRLGQIDVGLGQQWGRLATLLTDLGAPDPSA